MSGWVIGGEVMVVAGFVLATIPNYIRCHQKTKTILTIIGQVLFFIGSILLAIIACRTWAAAMALKMTYTMGNGAATAAYNAALTAQPYFSINTAA